MLELKTQTKKFTRDLTGTKTMSLTAAAVFACTVLPISGGAIKPYEVNAAIAALNGERPEAPMARPSEDVGINVADARPQRQARVIRTSAPAPEAMVQEADLDLAGGKLDTEQERAVPAEAPPEPAPIEPPILQQAEILEIPVVEEPSEFDDLFSG